MKKPILLLVTAFTIISTIQSCKKKESPLPPVITNLNIDLNKNQAYTFVLPENTSDTPYKITLQAVHYNLSTVGKDASGNEIYQYTPETDFIGNDVMSVANTEEHRCNGHHPHHGFGKIHIGHHGNDHDADDVAPNIVNIHFSVGTSGTITKTSQVSSESK